MKKLAISYLVSLALLLSVLPTLAANQTAIFAGGCFWCMQPAFDKVHGVVKTTVGYIGGTIPNPTYKLVSSGKTNYTEAIAIEYDPQRVSYQKLLTTFWHNIDPTRNDGQFCDTGRQYRPEIFYTSAKQKTLADQSKKTLIKSGIIKQPIVVAITAAGKFYPAEQYHQNYYKKNPLRYRYYRYSCRRDMRLKQLWGNSAGH